MESSITRLFRYILLHLEPLEEQLDHFISTYPDPTVTPFRFGLSRANQLLTRLDRLRSAIRGSYQSYQEGTLPPRDHRHIYRRFLHFRHAVQTCIRRTLFVFENERQGRYGPRGLAID